MPVRALDPAYRLGSEGLGEGDVVRAGDLVLRVVATPGHTSDSLSFLLPAEGAVLTGDTVLGRGSTVVAYPDGRLAAYLESLERLRDLAEVGAVTSIWPGHGPVLPDAIAAIEGYQEHRAERLEQVRAAVAAGAADARAPWSSGSTPTSTRPSGPPPSSPSAPSWPTHLGSPLLAPCRLRGS